MTKKVTIFSFLLAALLLLPGCNKPSESVDDPFDTVGSVDTADPLNTDSSNKPPVFDPSVAGSAQYDPNAPHGKKAMYGTTWNFYYTRKDSLNAWGDFYFILNGGLYCYDRTGKNQTTIACFDPLCTHSTDKCPAYCPLDTYKWFNSFDGEVYEHVYPYCVFIDYSDNVGAPVIYSVYRAEGPKDSAAPGNYVIQRYDLSAGERVTLCDGIVDSVMSAYTYGDNLYYTTTQNFQANQFTMNEADCTYTMWVLPKSGGTPKKLQPGEEAHSLDILDITDDGIYYMVNARYIYHCSLALEEPTLTLDVESINDKDNKILVAALREGYLFYYNNLHIANASIFPDLYAGDCYRIPLNDPSAPPVKIAENVVNSVNFRAFTDHYLYYLPCVMKTVEIDENSGLTSYNYSDGVVKAVNLFTGETVTCIEDLGISFFTGSLLDSDGDSIFVYGQAYEEKGKALANGGRNYIRIYPDGRKYEIWCTG